MFIITDLSRALLNVITDLSPVSVTLSQGYSVCFTECIIMQAKTASLSCVPATYMYMEPVHDHIMFMSHKFRVEILCRLLYECNLLDK